MQRVISRVIAPWLALAVAIGLILGFGQQQPAAPQIARLHLTECRPPCWVGIVPGETLFEAFKRLRFIQDCGVAGYLAVEEFRTARLWVYPFNQWRQTCCPNEPDNMDPLESFSRIDRWQYIPVPYHINGECHRSST
jgi:hypothetical protein